MEWSFNDDKWRVDFSEFDLSKHKIQTKKTPKKQHKNRFAVTLPPHTHTSHTSPSCTTGKCDSRQDFTHKPSSVRHELVDWEGQKSQTWDEGIIPDSFLLPLSPAPLPLRWGEISRFSGLSSQIEAETKVNSTNGGLKRKRKGQQWSKEKSLNLFNSGFLFLRLQVSCRHPRSL